MIQEPYIAVTLTEATSNKGTEGNNGSNKRTLAPLSALMPFAPSGRLLTISFHDIPLPSRKDILHWRREVKLPKHIAQHCDAVGQFAKKLTIAMLERGVICRPLTLQKAGELHDLFRFLDFRIGGWGGKDSPENKKCWARWRRMFPELRHEAACAQFLSQRGYDALARIVEVHGLTLPSPHRTTIEQKILFYADKRVRIDECVSLDERFHDFQKRYGKGIASKEHRIWYNEAKRVERELFPPNVPME